MAGCQSSLADDPIPPSIQLPHWELAHLLTGGKQPTQDEGSRCFVPGVHWWHEAESSSSLGTGAPAQVGWPCCTWAMPPGIWSWRGSPLERGKAGAASLSKYSSPPAGLLPGARLPGAV